MRLWPRRCQARLPFGALLLLLLLLFLLLILLLRLLPSICVPIYSHMAEQRVHIHTRWYITHLYVCYVYTHTHTYMVRVCTVYTYRCRFGREQHIRRRAHTRRSVSRAPSLVRLSRVCACSSICLPCGAARISPYTRVSNTDIPPGICESASTDPRGSAHTRVHARTFM